MPKLEGFDSKLWYVVAFCLGTGSEKSCWKVHNSLMLLD